MASSNKTPHYNLSQFAPTDKPAWQGDYNADMKKIDNGIYAAQNKADSLDASVSEATNKATQALEKAEAAEDAAENAAALAQEAKTTADNISGDLSGKVNKAGDTMTGPLVLSGDPTQPMEAATKQYVDQHGGGTGGDFLPLSGGTMTGPITLAADPSTAMQAATKQYADKMLPLAGGTMTGNLLLNGKPTQDNGAATKKYVDDAVAGGASGGSVTELDTITLSSNFDDLHKAIFLVNESLVLIYVYFYVNTEISKGSPLFAVELPAGYTMVETGLVGFPGWSISAIEYQKAPVRKFDFNPMNYGSSPRPTIQVVYSTESERSLEAHNQVHIFAMVQVRKS